MKTNRRIGKLRHGAGALLGGAVIAALGAGCFNRETAQPLTSDAFVSQRVEGRADPEPIDRPGQVITEGVKPPVDEGGPAPVGGTRVRDVREISPEVRQSTRNLEGGGRTRPGEVAGASTAPVAGGPRAGAAAAGGPRLGAVAANAPATTAPAGDPSGQYVLFGAVLAEVNDQPIYAHKVLALLDNALRAEAQNYPDARQFKPVAAKLIGDEIRTQVRNELVFAVAEKSLDPREKEVAKALAAQWQKEQETKAGGSLELAKRRWADEGWDFNDRIDYQYRLSMTQVYYQRRVFPMVHVAASDIRRYYQANKDTEFTNPARAKFRVIRIDPKALKLPGGAADAKRLAEQFRAKATAPGADFEQLARDPSNDPVLQATGGLVPGNDEGWLPKGTYVAEKVEAAVWETKPGAVTNVIEDRGAFYIAKLEERQDPVAREFESLEVQEEIEGRLQSQQLKEQQDRHQRQLIEKAVIQEHPQMLQIALDMAMQRYATWARQAAR